MTSPPHSQPGNASELLPCPFCGGEARSNGLSRGVMGQIYCVGEECFGPRTTALTLQDSIVQWNTRAAHSRSGVLTVEAIEAAVREHFKSIGTSAVVSSDGIERVYYSGFSLKKLAQAVASSLSSTESQRR